MGKGRLEDPVPPWVSALRRAELDLEFRFLPNCAS